MIIELYGFVNFDELYYYTIRVFLRFGASTNKNLDSLESGIK